MSGGGLYPNVNDDASSRVVAFSGSFLSTVLPVVVASISTVVGIGKVLAHSPYAPSTYHTTQVQ